MRRNWIIAALCLPLLAGCISIEVEVEDSEMLAELMERREHDEHREHPGAEEAHELQLHAMRLAVEAWSEADRHELAESMEHALHATELRLEGRRDREAIEIMESAPGREDRMELLRGAARLYEEWEMPDRSELCNEAAEMLEQGHGGEHRGGAVEELEARLRELEERMEGIEESLLDLRNR